MYKKTLKKHKKCAINGIKDILPKNKPKETPIYNTEMLNKQIAKKQHSTTEKI